MGKDTATGGGDHDLYDFNAVADSQAGGATRDVITDFAHLVGKIDLMGIDADGASEFEIQLTGIKTLTVADFYL